MIVSLFAGFAFHVGRLVLRKEQARNRTDATAYSAGTDYARAMNLLSMTNKLVAAAALAKVLEALPIPVVSQICAAAPDPGTIQKIQDLIAGTGTASGWGKYVQAGTLVEISCLATGWQNGLWAWPIQWNQGDDGSASLLPSLNVRRRYLGEFSKQEQKDLKDLGLGGKDRYSYKPKGADQRVDVDSSRVVKDTYASKSGKSREAHRYVDAAGRSTYVKKEAGGVLPLDLAETGPHNLVVWTLCQSPGLGIAGGEAGMVLSISKVEVGGGTLSVFDLNGASWSAYLVPCRPEAKDPVQVKSPGKTGSNTLDAWLSRLPLPGLAAMDWEILH